METDREETTNPGKKERLGLKTGSDAFNLKKRVSNDDKHA